MAIKADYQAGFATLAEAGTTVTFSGGANITAADIQPGDTFHAQNLVGVIATVTDSTHVELTAPWTGTALVAATYRVRFQPDGSRYTAALRDLVAAIGGGSLAALQAVTGAADKIPYFIGPGTMALADFKAWALSFLSLTPAANKLAYFDSSNTAALTDLTVAGRALLDDANASAQLDTLGFSAFIKTLVDDANAGAAQTTLGISTFIKALLDDTTSAQAFASLGGSSGSGWMKLPGGLLVQWATTVTTSDASTALSTITFATPFASGSGYIWVPVNGSSDIPLTYHLYFTAPWPQAAAVAYQVRTVAGVVAPNQLHRINWIAIGLAP